jgi:hypothetical protein
VSESLADPDIPEELHEEATAVPGGYVYQIAGRFGPDDAVPPEAIIGAWPVGKDGKITGEFIPNPNYRGPQRRASAS